MTAHNIKAVIFDVDGTLIDSVDHHAAAWLRAFEHYHVPASFHRVRSQIGKGGDQLMPTFMTPQDVERRGEEIEAWRSTLFKREYLPLIVGFAGVPELFDRIRYDGKRLALASSAKAGELARFKQIAGIDGKVDVETSSDDANRSKPHPDIFEAALAKLNVAPQEAIVVGDSPFDAEAAAKAGLATIGLLCGGFARDDLLRAGASQIFDDPAALLSQYDRSLIAGDALE